MGRRSILTCSLLPFPFSPPTPTSSEFYSTELSPTDDVLDICSSWVSHYPTSWSSVRSGNVVGLGMNEEEVRLDERAKAKS